MDWIDSQYVKRLRLNYPDVFRLADNVLNFAWGLTKGGIPYAEDNRINAWRFWNVGFAVAAFRLFRAAHILVDAGLTREAQLPARALLELLANQAYMAGDPQERATDFLHQANASKKRLAVHLHHYGLADDEASAKLSRNLMEEQKALSEQVGSPTDAYVSIRPFGKTAKNRISDAGLSWHYDLFYGAASDVAHMSAVAVDALMDWNAEKGALDLKGGPDNDGAGVLTVATEIMLRIFYKTDEALELKKQAEIDNLVKEYWLIHKKKGLTLETLIENFRGAGS